MPESPNLSRHFCGKSQMQSGLLMRLALPLMLLPLTLQGCSKTTAFVGPTDISCAVFRPISWSAKDTPETVREVKSFNAAWIATCRD